MTYQCNTYSAPAHRIAGTGFFARIKLAHAAWRQRINLSRLDDAALKDIGVTRFEAQQEISRPVWDVPSHWLR
ncbi:MAG: DUF1127 domain-containing protein [Rhodobacter sp.]|nr:DUF1127 domain-containing protein [Rhodobacter sp.]